MTIAIYDAPVTCPRCMKTTDALAGGKPGPGKVTFCTACGCVSVMVSAGILREMSTEQRAELPPVLQEQIAWAEAFRLQLETEVTRQAMCQCRGCRRWRAKEAGKGRFAH